MSRNRSIAKRMGGEHTRTPKAGDKSYAKVLFSLTRWRASRA